MAISHPFVSAKADGTDATLVRPSDWNANHNITPDTIANMLSDHNKAAHDALAIDHTTLTNKGTNTHAQIDTEIGTTLPGLVTTHAAVTSTHGVAGNILGTTTAAATYAPISKGVTNGDTHDHVGGDGANIKLINILSGITPTAATWTTTPTTLGNCTDSNYTTITGWGSKNVGTWTLVGSLTFDLGSSKLVMVGGRVGLKVTNSSDIYVYTLSSADNITYTDGGLYTGVTHGNSNEEIIDIVTKIVNGRYIKIEIFNGDIAATGSARFYEIVGYELNV